MKRTENIFKLLRLVLIVVVLMFLVGATVHVAFQDNGIVDRAEQEYMTKKQSKTIDD